MNNEKPARKSRRKFLLEVGTGAVALTAAPSLVRAEGAVQTVRPSPRQVRIGVVGGRFGEIFYSESEYHHTGVGPYAYGSSFDCQSCDFVHSIDQVEKGAKSSGKLVPTWA